MYVVIDMLNWRDYPLFDCTAEFRLYWMQTKLVEEIGDGITSLSINNQHPFIPAFSAPATPAGIATAYTHKGYPMDGLLFMHSEGHYESGCNPLTLLWKDASVSPRRLLCRDDNWLAVDPSRRGSPLKALYLQVRKGGVKADTCDAIDDEVMDIPMAETDEELPDSFTLCTSEGFSLFRVTQHELALIADDNSLLSMRTSNDFIACCEYESLFFDERGDPVLNHGRILHIIDKRSSKLPVDSLSKIIFFEQLSAGANHGDHQGFLLSGLISIDQLIHP
jgi:hypothetical protein